MAKQHPSDDNAVPQSPAQNDATRGGTFKTDVSETDDEGTTVREAEVREDDLSEVQRQTDKGDKGRG